MALRTIRELGDPILRKTSKEVREITPRVRQIVEDMLETMYADNGVGLAAPQIGILKRIVVIDVGEEQEEPYILINPEILSVSGSQTGHEGCLSVPGKSGIVTRPNEVEVRAFDENMRAFTLKGSGLLARAVCHEVDHLDGKMYVDLVEGDLVDVEDLEEAD
ncbi:MAG: peptide deformylase [Lachnospiraceae bacterium]|nr:peptide deformylase [Lachnospiraceae bacterium]